MKVYWLTGILFLVLAGFISCTEKGAANPEEGGAEIQGNTPSKKLQRSELAQLMLKMYANGEEVRKQILDNEPKLTLDLFEDIHTATPTDEGVHTPEFDAYATGWQTSMKNLGACAKPDRKKMYNIMIDNCISCHTSFCPGPRMKIRKLYMVVPEKL